MFSLVLENKNGDQLTFSQNSPYTISDIQGLNPPDATINTSEVSLIDGGKYNSAKVNMRQLMIAFAIETSAAYNRVQMYKVLKTKEWVKMYYSGDYRNVYITGYIQSIDISYFEKKQIVTVDILCPQPYFKAAEDMINSLSNIIGSFHFPFMSTAEPELVMGYLDPLASITIDNVGDVETGLIFTLIANASVTNPKIFDYVTQEFIGLNFTMLTNDEITIDTTKGNKSITLLRNGVETNIFNSLMKNSTWLQLPASGGVYSYEVGTGEPTNLSILISYSALYEGV